MQVFGGLRSLSRGCVSGVYVRGRPKTRGGRHKGVLRRETVLLARGAETVVGSGGWEADANDLMP